MNKGQALALLEPERTSASYEESLLSFYGAPAGLIRARAEIAGVRPIYIYDSKFAEFSGFAEASWFISVSIHLTRSLWTITYYRANVRITADAFIANSRIGFMSLNQE